jgi:predicted porin
MLSSSWATKKHNQTIRDATFYLSRNTSTFLNKKIKLNYQETRTTNNTQATQQQAANAIFLC